MSRTDDHPTSADGGASAPRFHGHARIPADLEPGEREMAGWFAELARVEADAELESRVVEAALAGTPLTVVRGGAIATWAAAALLLVGLGLAFVLSGAPVSDGASGPQAAREAKTGDAKSVWVMDDPDLVLYHDLETFDGLGRDSTDLLALDDR